MAAFSAQEQLILELVNRARLDPAAEATRLGISLNQGLTAGTISATQKAPLAGNPFLVDAARAHSSWMLATDVFSHTGKGGSSPTSRMQAAGYTLTGSWSTGENIAWIGTTGTVDQNAFTQQAHDNLFRSPGHRVNILSDSFLELGNGVLFGGFFEDGINWNAIMVTENFGRHGSGIFVTGVAHKDTDNDNFYDIGDARGSVTVTVKSGATTVGTDVTEAAGGYGVNVASSGTYVVTFSGGGLAAPVAATVATGASSVKVDLLGTSEILSSGTTTLGAGAVTLTLVGINAINGAGNSSANIIVGNKAANVLSGAAGNDTIYGGLGNDILIGGAGRDTMVGGAGNDTFRFAALSEMGNAATTRDIITDFLKTAATGADKLDLSLIDAKTAAGTINDAFTFVTTKGTAFSAQGQIRWFQEDLSGVASDKTIIIGNTDTNLATAEFHIELRGLVALAITDFVL